jgi:hypothetical protein
MFAFGQEQDRFPRNPILIETPGQLCTKSQTYRYLENIPYCERNVEKYVKNAIIQKYDNLYGFQIGSMNRLDFKIDHLIPLCAGGSNEEANLWPQHKSVYTITDPLESVICLKMQEGKLQQSQAVNLIIQAKMNINEVQAILKKINSL